MANPARFKAPRIAADGGTLEATDTAGNAAIPTLPNGDRPRFVLVSVSSANVFRINFGDSNVTSLGSPAAGAVLMSINGGSQVFDVSNCTHFSWNAVAGQDILVCPLDNNGGISG